MKAKFLSLLLCFALFFTSCSSSEEVSKEEKNLVYTGNSFNDQKGYSVYVKDSVNYGLYEYDVNSISKTDMNISIPVVDTTLSFLHSFVFEDYIYILSSSIYYDSFITRVSASNPNDTSTITFSDSEFISFDDAFDNVVFSEGKIYFILSKNNTFSDGHKDYLTQIDFTDNDYKRLEEVPLDSFILTASDDNIYINGVEDAVNNILEYNATSDKITSFNKTLDLTAMYILKDNYLFTMHSGSTGIMREDLDTNKHLEVTLSANVPSSRLIGFYDNRVVFGYEKLDEYLFFNMDLSNMFLNEMYLFYDNTNSSLPPILAELDDSFIVSIKDDLGNENIAKISKIDFWTNNDEFLIFS